MHHQLVQTSLLSAPSTCSLGRSLSQLISLPCLVAQRAVALSQVSRSHSGIATRTGGSPNIRCHAYLHDNKGTVDAQQKYRV